MRDDVDAREHRPAERHRRSTRPRAIPTPTSGSERLGPRGRAGSFAGPAAAGALAVLAALHAAWATGSAWPARDRRRLAQLVAGAEEMPGRAPCTVVACGLATSSVLVAGLARKRWVARVSRSVVCGAFLVRGAAGLTGSTHRLVSWTPAAEFVRRDRRCYGPVCLGIGAAVATTLPQTGLTHSPPDHG